MLDLVGEDSVHIVAEEVRTRLEMTRDAIAVGSRTVPDLLTA
jgi:hypothetical protein